MGAIDDLFWQWFTNIKQKIQNFFQYFSFIKLLWKFSYYLLISYNLYDSVGSTYNNWQFCKLID